MGKGGGVTSLLGGGGEMEFFSHPFFMTFLLSDLQLLFVGLTGRFSFIFKHLWRTLRESAGGGGVGGAWRQGWVKVETSHRSTLIFSAAQLKLLDPEGSKTPSSKYFSEIEAFSTEQMVNYREHPYI